MDNQDKKTLNLVIGGVHLPLVIAANDAELLTNAANFVDKQISERRQKNSVVKPLDVTAIMVALSTASELLIAQRTIEQGIQEQLSPHLNNLRDELTQMHNYADDVIQQLGIENIGE